MVYSEAMSAVINIMGSLKERLSVVAGILNMLIVGPEPLVTTEVQVHYFLKSQTGLIPARPVQHETFDPLAEQSTTQ